MAWVSTITDNGISMLNSVAGGSILTITRTVTGTGTTSSPQSATSVSSPVSDMISSVTRRLEATGVRFLIKVYSSPTPYKMKQIGVFGKVDNGQEQLFSLLQNSDGVDVPSSGSFPDFAFNMALFLQTDRATSFNVTIDPTSMVTEGELEETLTIINNHFTQIDSALEHVLPDVTSADNGKFLVVDNGEWAAVRIASASGGSY